ncbi:12612_t:CDS:2 [Funneliformis mosseae]|uniref:12612_t:CDS:1 n=1 Tax=Funneliformis mosseae TaxID=27381 RepID=A0A9N8VB29_FUNMO|nr:12612_t:CDS:2 [Funneliformis mosseae]
MNSYARDKQFLQSVGVARLGIEAVIAADSGGDILGRFIAKAMLKILLNHERLTKLDNFITINNDSDDDDNSLPIKVKDYSNLKSNFLF